MFNSLFSSGALAGAASLTARGQTEAASVTQATMLKPKAVAPAAGGDVHDSTYYAKCMVGGVLSCGLTHTAIVPLDLVKCRLQANPTLYKGTIDGVKTVIAEGTAAATLGWAPTFIGYSMQGLCKFGFYEIFKDVYSNAVGEENAFNYRTWVYLAASASAEVIADAALCPMESVKVRMQTSPPEAMFPSELGVAVNKIMAEEGMNGFYKGLVPLWARQVPYTMVKFASFEKVVEWFYSNMFTAPKDTYSKGTQLSITFASGYIAGVFCAIVSHPADTVVSKLNSGGGGSVGSILAELGPTGIWRGLGARIVMIGTLTGLQWWIYDTFKAMVGLQTSGGKK
jgi:solute carrier family 25 phosphate transporter 3